MLRPIIDERNHPFAAVTIQQHRSNPALNARRILHQNPIDQHLLRPIIDRIDTKAKILHQNPILP